MPCHGERPDPARDGWDRLREPVEDLDGPEDAWQQSAATGHSRVWAELARLRAEAGDRDGDEQAAASGYLFAWAGVARLREAAEDRDGAERIRRFGISVVGLPEAPWWGRPQITDIRSVSGAIRYMLVQRRVTGTALDYHGALYGLAAGNGVASANQFGAATGGRAPEQAFTVRAWSDRIRPRPAYTRPVPPDLPGRLATPLGPRDDSDV